MSIKDIRNRPSKSTDSEFNEKLINFVGKYILVKSEFNFAKIRFTIRYRLSHNVVINLLLRNDRYCIMLSL